MLIACPSLVRVAISAMLFSLAARVKLAGSSIVFFVLVPISHGNNLAQVSVQIQNKFSSKEAVKKQRKSREKAEKKPLDSASLLY